MASKNWRERLNLAALTDEAQEEYLRARRRRGFSQPLIFVVVVVASIFVLSLFFRVEDIQVEGNTHYTDEEIIRAIDIEEGDNLFFFDRFAAISRVFSKLPYIEEVTLKRALPNRITISVEESRAMAYLILGDEEWTMDHNCKILGKAAEGETAELVPIVNFDPGTLFIGERLTAANGNETPVDWDGRWARKLTELTSKTPTARKSSTTGDLPSSWGDTPRSARSLRSYQELCRP